MADTGATAYMETIEFIGQTLLGGGILTVLFNLNGVPVTLDIEEDMPLLWAIRDELGLTGTKYGCGVAACGACTVHVDGVATRSCSLPVGEVAEKNVTTIEGLSDDGSHPVQRAWLAQQVPQCGYCQSGMLMATAALLSENTAPTDADIDAAITNVCRCGTYNRIRAAIKQAGLLQQEARKNG